MNLKIKLSIPRQYLSLNMCELFISYVEHCTHKTINSSIEEDVKM